VDSEGEWLVELAEIQRPRSASDTLDDLRVCELHIGGGDLALAARLDSHQHVAFQIRLGREPPLV